MTKALFKSSDRTHSRTYSCDEHGLSHKIGFKLGRKVFHLNGLKLLRSFVGYHRLRLLCSTFVITIATLLKLNGTPHDLDLCTLEIYGIFNGWTKDELLNS